VKGRKEEVEQIQGRNFVVSLELGRRFYFLRFTRSFRLPSRLTGRYPIGNFFLNGGTGEKLPHLINKKGKHHGSFFTVPMEEYTN